MPDNLYSVTEAAAMLGVMRTTVHHHIRVGNINPRKIGNTYALTPFEVEVLRTCLVPQRQRKT